MANLTYCYFTTFPAIDSSVAVDMVFVVFGSGMEAEDERANFFLEPTQLQVKSQ